MLIWFIVGTLVVSIIAFMYSRNHRETEPFNLIKGLADKGSVRGQIDLAMMYYNGTNVRQDFTKAIEWAQKAANQGHARAQYELNLMREKGTDIQQDYKPT